MAIVSQIIREEEGNRLRSAYQRMKMTKRITQTSISADCGWSNASTFNRLLSGQSALTLESLTKLASVLGVSPASISPRLIQDDISGLEGRLTRQLSVSLVKSVFRGSWGEPFLTSLRLRFSTVDRSAFALTFDPGEAPQVFSGWVVVVEPERQVAQNDFVIYRHAAGKYSCGRIQSLNDDGTVGVEIEGMGLVLSSPKRCMLVSTLCRPGDLYPFRTRAES